ncbi:hypothetical protein Tco_1499929 [Tanacetum coccineum]
MAATAIKHMASNFAKLDKFEGMDFRRWQKKMHFLLSSMSVVYVLNTLIPEDDGDDATVEQIRKGAKWDNDDYFCRGLILNGMSDLLFNIYQNVESSKELWDSLEAKYMAEDASNKNFLVSNFTNYKMTDSRPVLEQYNELLGILEDFKHTLKHKKEELTLVELGSHLRIEESLRVQDNDKPKSTNDVGPLVVNMVEHNNSFRYNDNKGIAKVLMLATKPIVQAQRVQWMDNDVAWWVDSGATVHVCKDRCWFKNYESLNDGSTLHMGNVSTALVTEHPDSDSGKKEFMSLLFSEAECNSGVNDIHHSDGFSLVLPEETLHVHVYTVHPFVISLACSLPHTDSEVEALVQKLIDEDKGRQNAILDLALQFENSCAVKNDLRNAYEKCIDISQESRALIDSFLKEGSDKDYELNLSMYGKAAKIEKQMDVKLAWLLKINYYRSQESVGCSSSQADLYLTEKELHQLHLDEEALRETLEEQAMNAKAREKKIRQKQADDDESFRNLGW